MIDTDNSTSTTSTGGRKGLTPNKKIAVAGGATAVGVTLIASLLAGGLTGANWTDKESPGDAIYHSAGQVDLTMVSDLSYMDDFTEGAGQDTATNTFSPYPGSALRRVWTGNASALQAGTVALSLGSATFDIQDSMGMSVGMTNWDSAFGTQVTVSLDGIAYADEDLVAPGIQFDLPADMASAALVITIDGSYPDVTGNETQGQTVKIVTGDIDLYQVAGQVVEAPTPAYAKQLSILTPSDGAVVAAGASFTITGTTGPGVPVCVTYGALGFYDPADPNCTIAGTDGTWSVDFAGLIGAPTGEPLQVDVSNYEGIWDTPSSGGRTMEMSITVTQI